MKLVKVKINNKEYKFFPGTSILEAIREVGLNLPSLCYLKEFLPNNTCGLCVVEVKNKGVIKACSETVSHNMEILTHTPFLEKIRYEILSLLYINGHKGNCGNCPKRENCQLLKLVLEYKAYAFWGDFVKNNLSEIKIGDIIFVPEKCIKCRLCVNACQKYGSGVIKIRGFGSELKILPPIHGCIKCGKCVEVCPTAAIIWNKN